MGDATSSIRPAIGLLLSLLLVILAACNPTAAPPVATASAPAATAPATVTTKTPSPASSPALADVTLPDFSLCWVAYSPTGYDPDIPLFPLPSELRDDLSTLVAAGFEGIITYGSRANLAEIPSMAKELGIREVILGIWNPVDEAEIRNAIAAAPFVDGYIIGNEGLANESYSLDELQAALARVRSETGKPVTTTERLEFYYSVLGLKELGDWLAPIVHPFWHQRIEPAEAAEWTAVQYEDLQAATLPGRAIMIKELGLPSEGDPRISETAQAEYYRLLQQIDIPVQFAYFEAFDQEWKAASSGAAVESHWGLFRVDRSPKPVVDILCGRTLPTAAPSPQPSATHPPSPTVILPSPTLKATVTIPRAMVRYLYGDSLAPGYELNIDNSSHQFGWLSGDSVLQADFLSDQQWAAVYITAGPPQPLGQRTEYKDLSGCDALLVDLWAARPGVGVKIGIKDIDDPDTGAETLASRVLTTEPLVYRFPLAGFTSADLSAIYLPFEVVYHGGDAATVFIDNIRLECRE